MNINQILGITLMVMGVILIFAMVFRSLRHTWTWSLYEVWVFPIITVVMILVGRWLMA